MAEGVKHIISALKRHKEIKVLNLMGNELKDDGVQVITSFLESPGRRGAKLVELNLADVQMGMNGVAEDTASGQGYAHEGVQARKKARQLAAAAIRMAAGRIELL